MTVQLLQKSSEGFQLLNKSPKDRNTGGHIIKFDMLKNGNSVSFYKIHDANETKRWMKNSKYMNEYIFVSSVVVP